MSIDPQGAAEWLQRYVDAWKSYDEGEISALFSQGIVYRYHPWDEPIVGRGDVVASWLGEGEGDGESARDEPGTYDASYLPFAVDGNRVVATGISTYFSEPGGTVEKVFHNCFLIEFDDDGLCSEFTEFFIQAP
jgi:hypothetical protein